MMAWDQIEPSAMDIACDTDDQRVQISMAISLKRIADALEKGATVVVAADDIIPLTPEPKWVCPHELEDGHDELTCLECSPF